MGNWIIIVDDDISALKQAGHFLGKAGFRVTGLRSGKQVLDFVRENGLPDLFLLDINIPDLDGFRTLDLLKKEMESSREVPVAFLSSEDRNDQEARGLESGAIDYIRKPFSPDVLVSRVRKILDVQTQIDRMARNAETDPLTGCMNRYATEAMMTRFCLQEAGFLCILDLDAFKSINDIFGHDTGDRILSMFSRIITRHMGTPGECGRIGGDEFVVFLHNQKRSDDLIRFTDEINEAYLAGAREILGDRPNFPLGVSVGAVSVPQYGRTYSDLFYLADQALHTAKRNGKHRCRLYSSTEKKARQNGQEMDLEMVTAILEERIEAPSAMWIGQDVFGSIYKYIVRYITRYHNCAYRVLLTIRPDPELDDFHYEEIIATFKTLIKISLRNSDVMMECGSNQVFLLLPEVTDQNIDRVMTRVMEKCNNSRLAPQVRILTEYAPVRTSAAGEDEDLRPWVLVVDQDSACRRQALQVLEEQNLKVTGLSSLSGLPELISRRTPELILLDLVQEESRGCETFAEMKKLFPGHMPPVIALCGDGDPETETECLRMGAIDFVPKPFVPETLALRAQHVLKIGHFQRYLTEVVSR